MYFRDKVQRKFIELLEEAASPKIESVQGTLSKIMSYNSPGKILDAETLYHILNVPPQERIFYGSCTIALIILVVKKHSKFFHIPSVVYL